MLHRIRDGYVTMVDLFRTVISSDALEEMLIEVGSRFSSASLHRYREGCLWEARATTGRFGFEWQERCNQYVAHGAKTWKPC